MWRRRDGHHRLRLDHLTAIASVVFSHVESCLGLSLGVGGSGGGIAPSLACSESGDRFGCFYDLFWRIVFFYAVL